MHVAREQRQSERRLPSWFSIFSEHVRHFERFLFLAGKASFDLFHVFGGREGFRADAAFEQGAHLGDGDAVERCEAFRLWQSLTDEDGVQAFEVGEDNELFERGVVADVALGVGVGVAPLLGGLSEQGDIEEVGLAGINRGGLGLRDGWRKEGLLGGVRVDAVIDFGEGALKFPIQLEAVVFLVLEATEFLDQIDFEFRADPHAELESDVGMGESAAIPACGGFESNGVGFLNPFFDTDFVTIQSSLAFNYGEFAIIKSGIEHGFPDAEEFDGVPIAKPVGDEKLPVFRPQHVGEGDIVAILAGYDRDRGSANGNGAGFGFAHRGVLAD